MLGDNAFGYGAEKRLAELLDNMVYKRLYVMSGNHYAGWKQLFEASESNIHFSKNGGAVIFVPNYLEMYINGQPIVASHYPMISWNGMSTGSWHLFGHVHGSLVNSELGRMYLEKAGKALEVSVEVSPQPWTFGEIREIMRNRDVEKIDHHDENTNNPF